MNLRLCGLMCVLTACPPLLADDSGRLEEIRQVAKAYTESFNRHDAEALGKIWAENAVHVDRETGERTEGRAAILADLQVLFELHPGVRLQFAPGSMRFIRPDVAQAEATATVSIPDQAPSRVAVNAIFVKNGETWQIDSVEELALPEPESAAAALAELDWLIGEWKDESDDVTAVSNFRWGAEGSFLVRSFSVSRQEGPVSEGTQVIGWDPNAKQFRSWTFNSDGSFGEATWARAGSDWIIKSVQTLAEGGIASGTYVLTKTDADAMSIQLLGHEINGQPQPTQAAVRVVRVQAEQAAVESGEAAGPAGGTRGSTGGKP